MSTAVEDIMESVANGVLRALDARQEAAKEPFEASALVRSGFNVSILIRCGGIIGPWELGELNPQPIPPGRLQGPAGG
jgi:hypothetical protein